jgi:acetyl esterase
MIAISIDYRLAPEHPYPLSISDSFSVFKYVLENSERLRIDSKKVIIAGDSAGS